MTDAISAVRRALVRVDDRLLAARDRLTPGQRWTASIVAALTMAVLLAGAPVRTVVRQGRPAVAPGAVVLAAPDRPTAVQRPGSTPSGPAGIELPGVPSTGSAVAGAVGGPALSAGSTGDAGARAPASVRVTALLPAATAPVGSGEADAAQAFLAGATFEVAGSASVSDPDACAAVGGERTLVLGPEQVPAGTLDCLRASGATLLAFEPDGTRAGVVSTRRARLAALVGLGSWAASTEGVLDGATGIVGAKGDEAWIERALPEVRSLGVDVQATAYVDRADAVAQEVRRFVAAGVRHVVLTAPAQVRQQWAAQHHLLDRQVRFVVADAHDGVVEERYAPTFDGSLALTTLRIPWHPRTHGESDEQRACRTRWESSAPGRRMAAGPQTRWVYSWCQHVAIAEAALRLAASSDRPLPELLAGTTVVSPLTSDLGPGGTGGWGPEGDAVVVWRASCGCWTEQRPFQSRRG